MREIVLDTETTGLDPLNGDRVVEIGCVELINGLPSGETFHRYFNPERDVPKEAAAVHGLTTEFLLDKPLFLQEAESFLDFIADDPLVIHNAPFDTGFLNAELARIGHRPLNMSRVIDTLSMARKKFPGSPASLDALCRRFDIDLSVRNLHGALLDAQLLAEVYLELCGGRQPSLAMGAQERRVQESAPEETPRKHREARTFPLSAEEQKAHETFLSKISDPIWRQVE